MHTPRICKEAWKLYDVWAAELGHRPIDKDKAEKAHNAYVEHRANCKDCDKVMQK